MRNNSITFILLTEKTQNYHIKGKSYRELTLRTGSPSLTTAARAMAPSERTRQSPKLTTCRFLRCLRAYADSRECMRTGNTNTPICFLLGNLLTGLTCAMASVPFLVKVLSLKFRTLSSRLCRNALANAITPAELIPFWGMWTSSRLPMS